MLVGRGYLPSLEASVQLHVDVQVARILVEMKEGPRTPRQVPPSSLVQLWKAPKLRHEPLEAV